MYFKPASIAALVLCATSFAQAPLTFEVATIKPAGAMDPAKMMSGKMRIGARIDAGRAEYNFSSLRDLIMAAYDVKPYQITGPDWINSDRWDIQAKLPEGATKEQVPQMLQAFLEERFKLKAHKETKEHNVYALVQGKNGPKFKEYKPAPVVEAPPVDPAKAEKEAGPSITVNGQTTSMKQDGKGGMSIRGGEGGNMKMTQGPNGLMHMEFEQMKMTRLVDFLSGMVDKPVVDQTELKGEYSLGMDLSMQDMMAMARRQGMMPGGGGPGGPGGGPGGGAGAGPIAAASDPGASSIFSTVESLGLKLAPKKAPIEQVIIDHLEKTPTEN